ncbi:hypothetical protein GW17_00051408 [Ensete ventricosum]|nr:hypothetical protein GW17_00051408 [Ensete ventricosum]
MISQRRVFHVCASKLASDESLGHQHIGAVYHREKSQIASTSESNGWDLIIQRYDQSGWRVGLLQCYIRLREPDKLEDKAEGKEATTSPEGLSYPKAIASVRKEVDSEERHSTAEVDLPIAKEEM